MYNFESLDILWAWIGHPSEKLWPFEFLESFHGSFFSISKYHGPQTYTRVKTYGCLNFLRASVYNFESLDILWAWIGHPSEKLWPFEFVESLISSFSSVSKYHGPHTYTRVKSCGRLNLSTVYVFNFEHLDILCTGIGEPSEKLWPLEFLGCFHGSFLSVSKYHGPFTYTRASRYILSLNWTSKLKVMTIWNSRELPLFIFERLDILCAWINIGAKCYDHLNFSRASVIRFRGSRYIMRLNQYPSEMLWQYDFLESFCCSFSSVSIYHGIDTYTRVKSYGRLNMSRAYVFNFERLDILCAGIEEPSKKLWPFEFLESFHGSFSSVSKYHGPHTYTRVKSYGCLNFLRSSVYNFESLNILWAWIGHPSEKLLPFEFVESFHCSFSSVSIYHRPHTYTRVKCYGRLNIMRAYMFNFRRLDILGAGMGVRVKSYDHLNFSRAFVVHFRTSRNIMGLTLTPESKVMSV